MHHPVVSLEPMTKWMNVRGKLVLLSYRIRMERQSKCIEWNWHTYARQNGTKVTSSELEGRVLSQPSVNIELVVDNHERTTWRIDYAHLRSPSHRTENFKYLVPSQPKALNPT